MNYSRRNFLKNLALAFTILPSAGRIWKAQLIEPTGYLTAKELEDIRAQLFRSPQFHFLPTFQDYVREKTNILVRNVAKEFPSQPRPRLYHPSIRRPGVEGLRKSH